MTVYNIDAVIAGGTGTSTSLQALSLTTVSANDVAEVVSYKDISSGVTDGGGGTFYFEGTVPTSAQVTGATSYNLSVSGATNASPIEITTSAAHGLTVGQSYSVRVEGVLGNTAANGVWLASVDSTTTMQLVGSAGNGAYTSGGTVRTVVVTTSAAHGRSTGQRLAIGDAAWSTGTGINGTWDQIAVPSTTSLSLAPPSGGIAGSYTSGGVIGDNGFIVPSTAGAGRWIRRDVSPNNVRWWGAKGDASNNETPAFQAALAAKGAPGSQGSSEVYVPSGTYKIYAPGVVLAQFHAIYGDGTSTILDGSGIAAGTSTAPAPPVLALLGGYNTCRDLDIANVPAYGVGLRVSVDSRHSNENTRVTNVFVSHTTSNTTAFGIGDDTGFDVSALVMEGCGASGAFNGTTTGIMVGDGGVGNVLDIVWHGGDMHGQQYGVIINGGELEARGLNFSGSSGADIWFKVVPRGGCSFIGGRTESAERFIINNAAHLGGCITVQNYSVRALVNTDGQAIIGQGAALLLKNLFLDGTTCPQFIRPSQDGSVVSDGVGVPEIDCEQISSDHLYPLGASPYSRQGRVIRARDTRFSKDANFLTGTPREVPKKWVRRINITTTSQTTLLWPNMYDVAEIRLSADAGAVTLPMGIPGQLVTLCFEQDGVGGHAYSWPANINWLSGSAPANATTNRNRQMVELIFNERGWEQYSDVRSYVPVFPASQTISETFSGSVGDSGRYYLGTPDGGGAYKWDLMPGGGSMGIVGGVCVVPSLGWVGDNGIDAIVNGGGLSGSGAAYVIETGMATTPTGISATFKWQLAEGIIFNCLDDQNYVVAQLMATYVQMRSFNNGVMYNYGNWSHGLTLTPGTSHTMLVKLTGTQFQISIDGGASHNVTWLNSDDQKRADCTRHGIISGSTAAQFTAFSVS